MNRVNDWDVTCEYTHERCNGVTVFPEIGVNLFSCLFILHLLIILLQVFSPVLLLIPLGLPLPTAYICEDYCG